MDSRSEIDEELRALGSSLSGINKPEVKQPPYYAFKLKEGVMQRVRKEEVAAELLELAPLLAAASKPPSQQLDAAYTAAFQQSVWNKIRTAQSQKVADARISWFDEILSKVFKPKFAFVYAIGLSVLFIGFLAIVERPVQDFCADILCEINKVNDKELENYIALNLDEFGVNTLMTTLEPSVSEDGEDFLFNGMKDIFSTEDLDAIISELNI
jgi:hypothetical protein